MDVPSLRDHLKEDCSFDLKLNLPINKLFVKLAESSLKNMDLDILEAALTL